MIVTVLDVRHWAESRHRQRPVYENVACLSGKINVISWRCACAWLWIDWLKMLLLMKIVTTVVVMAMMMRMMTILYHVPSYKPVYRVMSMQKHLLQSVSWSLLHALAPIVEFFFLNKSESSPSCVL